MKHRALEILHRLREYSLEKQQLILVQKQRTELAKQADCERSLGVMQGACGHSIEGMKSHDYARRDGCVREARVRHTIDLRQLGLCQIDTRNQVQATLKAKTQADMIAKVLEHHRSNDRSEFDMKTRKEVDDIAQNQFTRRAYEAKASDPADQF